MQQLLRHVLHLEEAFLGDSLLLHLLELLHRVVLALALPFHLLLHDGFAVSHLISLFRQAQVGLVTQMRQVSWLLYRNQLLHLCLLLDLLKVDSIVAFKTVLVLAILPQRCQVVNL